MSRNRFVLITLLVISIILIAWLFWFFAQTNKTPNTVIETTQTQTSNSNQAKTDENPAPPKPVPTIYYPLTNYQSRITNRGHGKSTTLADSEGFACGGQFEGIHVGDDLEITAAELKQEIPIYAISNGTVRQASVVGGYGGLLITQNKVDGEIVTAYYGHIDLKSIKYSAGQSFKAGNLLGYLGDNCTTETSNERKHLHFAIRKGTSIDVRGYLSNNSELNEWHDPAVLLKNNSAGEPGK